MESPNTMPIANGTGFRGAAALAGCLAVLWGAPVIAEAEAVAGWGGSPHGGKGAPAALASVGLRALQDESRIPASYMEAREALNGRDYARAALLFRNARLGAPSTRVATDAAYWEAFSLYRVGGVDAYRRALATLESAAAAGRDADELYIRIRTELALSGDPAAVAAITRSASLGQRSGTGPATISVGGRHTPVSDELGGFPGGAPACAPSEHTLRLADLNALRRVRGELALPVLRAVLLSRDECSALLRRHAVLLTVQTGAEGVADLLIDVARRDPSPDVRAEAVFWLSEVSGDEVTAALVEFLHDARDPAVRERAAFSLARHDSPIANEAIRALVADDEAPAEMRIRAVEWLAADLPVRDPEHLVDAYPGVAEPRVRDSVIKAIATSGEPWATTWLRERVLDDNEPDEVRKVALFRLGQTDIVVEELLEVYAALDSEPLREHAVFVIGQRPGHDASNALLRAARSARSGAVRNAAVFWLEQRRDPAALEALVALGMR